MRHWLVKSEPESFSIDALKKAGSTPWDGVRNYQARNFMTTDMKVGDPVLFYHSNTDVPGVVGLAVVSRAAAVDESQFKKKSDYFEPRATRDKPVWFCVELKFKAKFARVIPLTELRDVKALADLPLLRKGQRLSVQPVSAAEFECIVALNHR